MGSKSGGAETNATSSPWGPSQGYLLDLMRQAQGMQQSGQGMTAPMTPWQAQGLWQQLQAVPGMQQQFGQANNAWQTALNQQNPYAGYENVADNPYVNAMHAASQQQINQNLERNVMPALTAGSMSVGGLNNSRVGKGGIAEGIAAGDTQTAIANSRAALNSSAYKTGLNASVQGNSQAMAERMNAMNQTGNMMQYGLMPGQATQNVGNVIQNQAQAQQMDPWNRLGWLGNLYGGMAGQGSQSTQEQPGGSRVAGALGGAAAGTAVMPGWGTAIGAGIGYLAS